MIEQDRSRVKWACRRGMLELDVIIMPFFEACFDALMPSEKAAFVSLLECDDPDLFMWLMGKGQSEDLALAAMITKIIEYNQSQLR